MSSSGSDTADVCRHGSIRRILLRPRALLSAGGNIMLQGCVPSAPSTRDFVAKVGAQLLRVCAAASACSCCASQQHHPQRCCLGLFSMPCALLCITPLCHASKCLGGYTKCWSTRSAALKKPPVG